MKKKIVFVTRHLIPGGAIDQLYLLMSSLDKRQFKIFLVVIINPKQIIEKQELKRFSQFARIYMLNRKSSYELAIFKELGKVYSEIRPDIVHTWMWTAGFYGRIATLFLRKKPLLIHSIRGLEYGTEGYNKIHLLRPLVDQLLNIPTRYITCNSKIMAEELIKRFNYPRRKIVVIPNAIDPETLRLINLENLRFKKKKSLNNVFTIGCVARLSEEKDIKNLLYAIPYIIEHSNIQISIQLIGSGPQESELRYLCRELAINDWVKFNGWLSKKDLIKYLLNNIDVLVLPSKQNEGLPNCIIEAMLCGLPIISTKVQGAAELIDNGKTGLLVPPRDSYSLARAILFMINSPNELIKMGKQGQKKIYEVVLTAKDMATQYTLLYQD